MAMVSMVVGGVTDESARFVAKVDGGGPVRIAYSTNSDMSSPSFSASQAVDSDGVAKVEVNGLTADTQYYWRVEDNLTIDTSATGKFRTFPTLGEPANFMFAAASCAGQSGGFSSSNRVSNHPVFDSIRGLSPLFFMHMGDLHYKNFGADTTDSVANRRAAFDEVLSQSRQHQLYREVPWVYVWDDHDWGPDNSDGEYAGAEIAWQVYRERVPHYDLQEDEAIYQSFGCGRVLVVALDVRSHRWPNAAPDTSSKTMLGAAQKSWLEGLLGDPGFGAEWLVLVSPSVWLGTSSDTWGSFATERAELVGMFDDLGWLDRMCIVSGDAHALAIASGSVNEHGGFPVYQFASLDSSPTSIGGTYDVYNRPGRNQFGTIQVHDSGAEVAVTGTAYIGSRAVAWHTSSVSSSRRRGPRPVVIAL